MSYPAYAETKPSGVDWLGDVPQGWPCLMLKRVARFAYGESLADAIREEGPIPVYGSNGVVGSHIVANAKAPALIIGRKGSYGKVSYSASPAFAIDTAFFVDKTQTKQDVRWLFYLLSSLNLDSVSQDTGVPGLSREDAYSQYVSLPPLPEQQQIAAFLDRKTAELDAVLRLKERQLELLAEKRQTLISQAVTRGLDPTAPLKPSGIPWLGDVPGHWEVKRLRHVVRDITNGTTATQLADGESDCPVTRIETISTGSVNLDKVGYVKCSSGLKDYLLKPNDILFSHINSLSMVGNCAIYEGDTPLYAGMNLLRLRPNGLVVGRWLWNWMRSSGANHAVKAGAKPAINQVSLPLGTIKDVPVLVPPLGEQNEILAYLDRETARMDSIAQAIRAQIEKVREYRQALISAAVTGKIDVRGEEKAGSSACQD